MRRATFTNANGVSVVFNLSPYLVQSLEGIDGIGTSVQSQKAPYQDGETFIDSLLSARTIVVRGKITGSQNLDSMYANRTALVSALNPKLGLGALLVEVNGFSKTISAVPVSSPQLKSYNYTEMFQDFMCTFYCPDPMFKDSSETEISLSVVASVFSIPFAFPTTFSTIGDGTVSVTNSGHVNTGFEIVIAGPSVNPVVTNEDTNEFIAVTATLDYGETLTINTNYGQKSVVFSDGVTETNYFANLDFDSTFFQFVPGANVLSITDDGGFYSGSCLIKYTNKFLGA